MTNLSVKCMVAKTIIHSFEYFHSEKLIKLCDTVFKNLTIQNWRESIKHKTYYEIYLLFCILCKL